MMKNILGMPMQFFTHKANELQRDADEVLREYPEGTTMHECALLRLELAELYRAIAGVLSFQELKDDKS